jgi:hypothetical protein
VLPVCLWRRRVQGHLDAVGTEQVIASSMGARGQALVVELDAKKQLLGLAAVQAAGAAGWVSPATSTSTAGISWPTTP